MRYANMIKQEATIKIFKKSWHRAPFMSIQRDWFSIMQIQLYFKEKRFIAVSQDN